jgi:hypothetical protein
MQSSAGAAAFVDARATRLVYPSSRRTPPRLFATTPCRRARVASASCARPRTHPYGPRRSHASVHVLGRRFLARVLAPECDRLVHCRPWRRTGLRGALRSAAPLWPAPNLSPRRTPCACAHPGARPCARIHAPPSREGTRTPAERRHRAGVAAPAPAPTSP